MLFDSHFHLTDGRLCERRDEIVRGFGDDNVLGGVEIGANYEELSAVFEFAKDTKKVYCTAGVHPLYANDFVDNDFTNFVAEHVNDKKFVAVGECGLDYHYPNMPSKDLQRRVFIRQILIANEYKKPLIVHSRDAAADTIAVLREYKDKLRNGVLIHCMSYNADFVKELVSVLPDAYFAFGGAITYKKNLDVMSETIRVVRTDRILIETDAPYLSPEPKRGTLNEPKFMQYTARRIADILNLTVDEVEQLTTQNAFRFFRIK